MFLDNNIWFVSIIRLQINKNYKLVFFNSCLETYKDSVKVEDGNIFV